jgi:hypothetical protein
MVCYGECGYWATLVLLLMLLWRQQLASAVLCGAAWLLLPLHHQQ